MCLAKICQALCSRWPGRRIKTMDLRSITELVDRRPYRPFVIELDNGRRVTVRHLENIIFFPSRTQLRDVIAYDEDQDLRVIFEPSAVSALLEAREDGNEDLTA